MKVDVAKFMGERRAEPVLHVRRATHFPWRVQIAGDLLSNYLRRGVLCVISTHVFHRSRPIERFKGRQFGVHDLMKHYCQTGAGFGHPLNRSSDSLSPADFDRSGLLPSMYQKRVKLRIAVERLQIGVLVHSQSDPNGQPMIHG